MENDLVLEIPLPYHRHKKFLLLTYNWSINVNVGSKQKEGVLVEKFNHRFKWSRQILTNGFRMNAFNSYSRRERDDLTKIDRQMFRRQHREVSISPGRWWTKKITKYIVLMDSTAKIKKTRKNLGKVYHKTGWLVSTKTVLLVTESVIMCHR